MRRGFCLLAAVILCLALTGCGCEHIWEDATCLVPKTCSLCGETEGDAAGHVWQEADCTTPETCSHCGDVRNGALGHEWLAATCETDEVCTLCHEINALAFGHSYGAWEGTGEAFLHTCQTCGKEESLTPEAFFFSS